MTAEAILRRLARDQWVRLNGTPRVTVLVGGARARSLWQDWLQIAALDGALIDGGLTAAMQEAVRRATAQPALPIAVTCSPAELQSWRAGRRDRLTAMLDEGMIEIPDDEDEVEDEVEIGTEAAAAPPAAPPAGRTDTPATAPRPAQFRPVNPRSAAEAALLAALDATPATAGRFELNGYLAVRFGSGAAEVDLLDREAGIAIEIDGYHHFGDRDAYRRDRRKDLLLQTQGLVVIRVLAEDVMKDARPAIHAVCQVLACRRRQRDGE